MKPKYPVYVISKGRWESRLTSKALEWMGVPYNVVVEPQEAEKYKASIEQSKVLILPFSNLGQGSIPARNWVWEHSIGLGARYHWILDDNIRYFHRFQNNRRYVDQTGSIFVAMEEFVARYKNVALAGPQYEKFVPIKQKHLYPFKLNTRIYSCILIRNDIPYRWRGKYNEDTDLSLRALKDGWCTILFYAFLAEKTATMTMKDGNTESLYKLDGKQDGRFLMAQSLQEQHPDVVKITRKWGRWQHQVDYRPFKNNQLIRKPGLTLSDQNNEFGMVLVHREPTAAPTP